MQMFLSQGGCSEGSYKPHSTCSQYFFCVHDKWTTQSCPDGLDWDNAKKVSSCYSESSLSLILILDLQLP